MYFIIIIYSTFSIYASIYKKNIYKKGGIKKLRLKMGATTVKRLRITV